MYAKYLISLLTKKLNQCCYDWAVLKITAAIAAGRYCNSLRYFRLRSKFCCSADFRLAVKFFGGFSASNYLSAKAEKLGG